MRSEEGGKAAYDESLIRRSIRDQMERSTHFALAGNFINEVSNQAIFEANLLKFSFEWITQTKTPEVILPASS